MIYYYFSIMVTAQVRMLLFIYERNSHSISTNMDLPYGTTTAHSSANLGVQG